MSCGSVTNTPSVYGFVYEPKKDISVIEGVLSLSKDSRHMLFFQPAGVDKVNGTSHSAFDMQFVQLECTLLPPTTTV